MSHFSTRMVLLVKLKLASKMTNTKPEGVLGLKDHRLESHSKLFQQTFADQLPLFRVLCFVFLEIQKCITLFL